VQPEGGGPRTPQRYPAQEVFPGEALLARAPKFFVTTFKHLIWNLGDGGALPIREVRLRPWWKQDAQQQNRPCELTEQRRCG